MEQISKNRIMERSSIIIVKNLTHYFDTRPLFKNTSFEIEKGSFVFLIGDTGSGKSTLLKILHGEIPPTAGILDIDGFVIGKKKRHDLYKLRRKVAIIYQDFFLIEEISVEENIILPLKCLGIRKQEQKKRLEIVLNILDLSKIKKERCSKLSGGEKQRVAIGRTIITNPSIILADEPTGSLDAKLTMRLMKIFRKLNDHGTTIILATHNLELPKMIKNSQVLKLQNHRLEYVKHELST